MTFHCKKNPHTHQYIKILRTLIGIHVQHILHVRGRHGNERIAGGFATGNRAHQVQERVLVPPQLLQRAAQLVKSRAPQGCIVWYTLGGGSIGQPADPRQVHGGTARQNRQHLRDARRPHVAQIKYRRNSNHLHHEQQCRYIDSNGECRVVPRLPLRAATEFRNEGVVRDNVPKK